MSAFLFLEKTTVQTIFPEIFVFNGTDVFNVSEQIARRTDVCASGRK
jgi:hypothetical protein